MAAPKTTGQQQKGGAKFFREVKTEMKKVVWPTKKEMLSYTLAVFVTVVFVTILIGVSDGIFTELFKLFNTAIG